MKRRLLIAAIFLLAGAVVNVAVAWGCAGWSRETVVHFPGSMDRETALWAEHRPPHFQKAPYWFGQHRYGLGRHQSRVGAGNSMTVLDAGWPCYALWGLIWEWAVPPEPGLHSPLLSHSFQLRRGFVAGHWREPRLIPLRPIWPGFAVNTLVYAVLVVVVWFAVRAGYQYLTRSRRGLCPKCGYPRGESAVCSECGKALTE